MEIIAEVTGDREVGLLFETFPQQARNRLMVALTRITHQLEDDVATAAPARTGELKGEIASFVDDKGDRIKGSVKVPASAKDHGKAAALEYGAHRPFTVKAYSRHVSVVFGKLVAPFESFVEAHQRTPNIAEHRFLRGPLAAMQSEILQQLNEALSQAAEAQN